MQTRMADDGWEDPEPWWPEPTDSLPPAWEPGGARSADPSEPAPPESVAGWDDELASRRPGWGWAGLEEAAEPADVPTGSAGSRVARSRARRRRRMVRAGLWLLALLCLALGAAWAAGHVARAVIGGGRPAPRATASRTPAPLTGAGFSAPAPAGYRLALTGTELPGVDVVLSAASGAGAARISVVHEVAPALPGVGSPPIAPATATARWLLTAGALAREQLAERDGATPLGPASERSAAAGPVVRYRYRFVLAGRSVLGAQAVLVHGGRLFFLTGTGPPASFPGVLAALDRILAGWAWS